MSFFQKSIRSDEDLLTSLRQGSEDAFTVIYERYHKLLYVLAYKYLKSTYSSEDHTVLEMLNTEMSHLPTK